MNTVIIATIFEQCDIITAINYACCNKKHNNLFKNVRKKILMRGEIINVKRLYHNCTVEELLILMTCRWFSCRALTYYLSHPKTTRVRTGVQKYITIAKKLMEMSYEFDNVPCNVEVMKHFPNNVKVCNFYQAIENRDLETFKWLASNRADLDKKRLFIKAIDEENNSWLYSFERFMLGLPYDNNGGPESFIIHAFNDEYLDIDMEDEYCDNYRLIKLCPSPREVLEYLLWVGATMSYTLLYLMVKYGMVEKTLELEILDDDDYYASRDFKIDDYDTACQFAVKFPITAPFIATKEMSKYFDFIYDAKDPYTIFGQAYAHELLRRKLYNDLSFVKGSNIHYEVFIRCFQSGKIIDSIYTSEYLSK